MTQLTPLAFRLERCLVCDHPMSALSNEAFREAVQAHVDYVNARLDPATDDHFEDGRLDALLAQ